MGFYQVPAAVWVSCDWACHRGRTPPSSEPGTDYATAYGTPVAVAWDGRVVDRNTSPGGAPGRYITVDLDDGNTVRYLHLAEVWAEVGDRVTRGQAIAASGASGYGVDNYYGPHVHTTLWEGPAWSGPTVDFETYVGPVPGPDPEPPESEDDAMPRNSGFYYTDSTGVTRYGVCNLGSGFFEEWSGVDGAYNNGVAVGFDTPPFAKITHAHRDYLARDCQRVRDGAQNQVLAQTRNVAVALFALVGAIVLPALVWLVGQVPG